MLVNGPIDKVEEFTYLGSVISIREGIEKMLSLRRAWQKLANFNSYGQTVEVPR